jgi:hypothetical protein
MGSEALEKCYNVHPGLLRRLRVVVVVDDNSTIDLRQKPYQVMILAKVLTLDKVFLSARRDGDVLWVDWMLIFRNGAVGMAQVAKGGVKPVYSTTRLGKGVSPLTRANIDTTPAETNVEGIDIAFPRVSLIQ